MLKNFKEENYHTNEVIVRDLLSKHMLWASQASQIL